MTDNIERTRQCLEAAIKFRAAYKKTLTEMDEYCMLIIDGTSSKISFHHRHAAALGKFFGRSGWIRKCGSYGAFNWEKVIDDVVIIIYDAEKNEFNDSPVPPESFPLQLEESI